jgi:hypothetical protein
MHYQQSVTQKKQDDYSNSYSLRSVAQQSSGMFGVHLGERY